MPLNINDAMTLIATAHGDQQHLHAYKQLAAAAINELADYGLRAGISKNRTEAVTHAINIALGVLEHETQDVPLRVIVI